MPERLVARRLEHEEINNNLMLSFNENKPVSLYINGPPGES